MILRPKSILKLRMGIEADETKDPFFEIKYLPTAERLGLWNQFAVEDVFEKPGIEKTAKTGNDGYLFKTKIKDQVGYFRELLRRCVVGWGNIVDINNAPVPFSPENFFQLLDSSDTVFLWFQQQIGSGEVFEHFDALIDEQRSETEKN